MMQAFGTKKLGQAAKGSKTSRSGFSTNVFIVVVTSQWEPKLDVRQGGGLLRASDLIPNRYHRQWVAAHTHAPLSCVLTCLHWHLKPDHSALPFIRFLSSGTDRHTEHHAKLGSRADADMLGGTLTTAWPCTRARPRTLPNVGFHLGLSLWFVYVRYDRWAAVHRSGRPPCGST